MIKSNLKEIMERLDVTYKQLEEKTGVSSQTITRARGEMISECRLSTLETIAKALGVSTKDLYDEKI
ncbi:helix-turn-helix transcriptional regulator [uncultured Desulfovibrio sp.]|uniref:helix-turn-helix domain-containing protein n=1 Tax=uncultured Desulfovibrio sp. TaxID=167968 RepID=UPI0025967C3B|nr:helix-turn-helix transcriptional regulator [uncultured Desulfovibrio sp.]